jgi:hypothetical protein
MSELIRLGNLIVTDVELTDFPWRHHHEMRWAPIAADHARHEAPVTP